MKLNTKIVKVLIFDFDGVLLDSPKKSIKEHQKLAKLLKLRVPKESEFKKLWGLSWEEVVENLWPDDYRLFRRKYREHYRSIIYSSFPGLPAILKKLSRKYLMAIITSRSRETLPIRAEAAGVNLKLFFFIQSFEDAKHSKPNPKVFGRLLRKLKKKKINKENTIFIGDTLTDYKAAKNVGICFIGVLSGAASRSDFLKGGLSSKCIIKSASDLPRYLSIHR